MSTLTVEQIQAIKDYRNRTGCSLKEAHRAIVEGAPPDATTTTDEQIAALDCLAAEVNGWCGLEWEAHPGPDPDGRDEWWVRTALREDGSGTIVALQMTEETARFVAAVATAFPSIVRRLRASRPPSEPTRRCNGHCHCHAGPDGFMHPPCCEDCSPSRPSSEPGERARALEEAARVLDSEAQGYTRDGAAGVSPDTERTCARLALTCRRLAAKVRALASAPASSPGSGEEEGLRARVEALLTRWAEEARHATDDRYANGMNDCEDDLRTALAGRADAGTNGGK